MYTYMCIRTSHSRELVVKHLPAHHCLELGVRGVTQQRRQTKGQGVRGEQAESMSQLPSGKVFQRQVIIWAKCLWQVIEEKNRKDPLGLATVGFPWCGGEESLISGRLQRQREEIIGGIKGAEERRGSKENEFQDGWYSPCLCAGCKAGEKGQGRWCPWVGDVPPGGLVLGRSPGSSLLVPGGRWGGGRREVEGSEWWGGGAGRLPEIGEDRT